MLCCVPQFLVESLLKIIQLMSQTLTYVKHIDNGNSYIKVQYEILGIEK